VKGWSYIPYAFMAVPLAFLGLPLYVFIPKLYSDMPGIGFGLAGIVIFLARLLDLITDPLMGYVGDKFRHKFHHLVWMFFGLPIISLGVFFLFNPPNDANAVYLALFLTLTYLGWTCISIPYYAWGVELGKTEIQQRKIAAWREGAILSGALIALGVVAFSTIKPMMSFTYTFLVTLILSFLFIFFLPRIKLVKRIAKPRIRDVWKNTSKLMRRLLSLHFLNALAAGIPATLFLIYLSDVLNMSEKQSGLLLLIYFFSGIIALPIWIKVANKFGEAITWQIAIMLAVLSFLPVLFIQDNQIWIFTLVCIITGTTLGADIALPAALQARLAANESLLVGFPREGASFGLWGLMGKLALACAVGFTFPILEWLPNSDDRAAALPWMYAFLPILIKLIVFFGIQRLKEMFKEIDTIDNSKGDQNENKDVVGNATNSIIFLRV